MPIAKCPRCKASGECIHETGVPHGGTYYDEYSFKCSRCGYGTTFKDGVRVDDPNLVVGFPIDHAKNKCPFCGQTGSGASNERFGVSDEIQYELPEDLQAVDEALRMAIADPETRKKVENVLLDIITNDPGFSQLSTKAQKIILERMRQKGIIH